jgi:hypothetical protein
MQVLPRSQLQQHHQTSDTAGALRRVSCTLKNSYKSQGTILKLGLAFECCVDAPSGKAGEAELQLSSCCLQLAYTNSLQQLSK